MSVPRPAMLVAMVTAPEHAGLGDDRGFLFVVAGVQHVMRDLALLRSSDSSFRFLDRGGADQHGLAALLAFLDQRDDGIVFLLDRAIDFVVGRRAVTGTLVGISTTSSL